MKKSFLHICLLLISILSFSTLNAQHYNADSLFVEVKRFAEKQEYNKAIQLTHQLKSDFPQDVTYKLYLASLYNWNNQSEKALEQLDKLTEKEKNSIESIQLYISTYTNLKQYEKVIECAKKGEIVDALNEDNYKIIEAQSYLELKDNFEAIELLKTIQKSSVKYKDAQYLLTQIHIQKKNIISAGYLLRSFSEPESVNNHFFNLDYSRKFGKNTIVSRFNYGNAFDENGVSGELDYYRKLSKSYLYFNAGLSDGNFVYPKYKLGVEWFKETKKLSYSIGTRFLDFKDANEVYLFTGHLGYKLKPNLLLAYRPYLVLNENKISHTQTLFLKRYNESQESFWQIDLQYGTVPYYFLSNQLITDLNTYRVGLNTKFKIAENMFLQPIALYEYQEYFPNEFRNVFNFQAIISYRF